MKKKVSREEYSFLTTRECDYINALIKNNGTRFLAAEELGVKENAIEKVLTRIRKKIKHAKTFSRKYKDVIKRNR